MGGSLLATPPCIPTGLPVPARESCPLITVGANQTQTNAQTVNESDKERGGESETGREWQIVGGGWLLPCCLSAVAETVAYFRAAVALSHALHTFQLRDRAHE